MKKYRQPRDPASAFESPTFSEHSWFHIDQPVGSMSISPCWRDVVLASKEGLHIVDLDNPYSPPRYLPHHTPWEVADVQWSPFASRDYWVVSTSNRKALVWNLATKSPQDSIDHVLHAHSRAITDINFSPLHPDVLSTCAVDSFVHCWDLRAPARPVVSLSDWVAGATQVKWNRRDPHILASSHDRHLHIWDDRHGAYPLRSIKAHDTKIYGVDWSRDRAESVVTCSLDMSIKLWDFTSEDDAPEKVIHTSYPVWRARHTPFGQGILAVPLRNNSDLHLFNRSISESDDGHEAPVYSFSGHKGQVKESLWRYRGDIFDGIDSRDFQLVSWGTDHELRLSRVEADILKRVGYEKGRMPSSVKLTRSGAPYRSFRDESALFDLPPEDPSGLQNPNFARPELCVSPASIAMKGRSNVRADTNPISWMKGVKISWDEETLGDEITHVGEKFTKVAFESVNVGHRKATVSMHAPWGQDNSTIFLKIGIKFPLTYPKLAIPIFNVQKTSSVTSQLIATITSGAKEIAKAHLQFKRGCLENVLRYFLGEHTVDECVAMAHETEPLKSPEVLGDESSDEDEDTKFQAQDLGVNTEEFRSRNANVLVPVPQSCGALWANDGRLLCFFPPKKEKVSGFLDGLCEISRLGRGDKTFEVFGRLPTVSPSRKRSRGAGTGTAGGVTTDDQNSDYTDDSDVDSLSSSSGSSDNMSSMPTQFHAPNTWRGLAFKNSQSVDDSQKSTNTFSTTYISSENKHNTICLYDLEDLQPSKRVLAQKYRIAGNPPDVCVHNMKVASECGFKDIAHIWGLIRFILEGQHPVDMPPKSQAISTSLPWNEPIIADGRLSNLDSDERRDPSLRNLPFKMNWGENPLGAAFFVPALYKYFESIHDIQMLGMLSYILHEPEIAIMESSHTQRPFSGQSASMKPNIFSASDKFYESSQQSKDEISNITRSASPIFPVEIAQVFQSDTPPTAVNESASILRGRKSSVRLDNEENILPDLEDTSNPQSGSNTGNMPSSFTRSFPYGPSTSFSPAESFGSKISAISSGFGGFGPSSITSKPTTAISEPVRSHATFSHHLDPEFMPPYLSRPIKMSGNGVNVTFKNQDAFNSSGRVVAPLLDVKKYGLFQTYREAYARLLFIWELPIQRCELLGITRRKLQSPLAPSRPISRKRASVSSPRHSSKQSSSSLDNSATGNGLVVLRLCGKCGRNIFTKMIGSNTNGSRFLNCSYCNPAQSAPIPVSCVVCEEVIRGMYIPCLKCGHITCPECHNEWFSSNHQLVDDTGHPLIPCPSGCECRCPEHIVLEIPLSATIRSIPSETTPTIRARRSHSESQRERQSSPNSRRRDLSPPPPPTPASALQASSALQSDRRRGSRSSEPNEIGGLDIWAGHLNFSSIARGLRGKGNTQTGGSSA